MNQTRQINTIECKDSFSFLPSFRRFQAAFERIYTPCNSPTLEFVSWATINDTTNDTILTSIKDILSIQSYSFVIKFRGLQRMSDGIYMVGYFEEKQDAEKYKELIELCKYTFTIEKCSTYSFGYTLLVPICLFRTTPTQIHINLDSWAECEFGELRMKEWCYNGVPLVSLRRFICHRGNIYKKSKKNENNPSIIDTCIASGYDVELDVWLVSRENNEENVLYLGHDEPQYEISFEWLMKSPSHKYIHTKTAKTLEYLLLESGKRGYEPNLFYHTNEHYAITTRKHVIVLPGEQLLEGSIYMMPEMAERRPAIEQTKIYAVCSDSLSNFSK